jgi:hypothetical protein
MKIVSYIVVRAAQLARQPRPRAVAVFRDGNYAIDKFRAFEQRRHPVFQEQINLRLRQKPSQSKQRRRRQHRIADRAQTNYQDFAHGRPVPTRRRQRLWRSLLFGRGKSQVAHARR